jgi:hypothetical protein
MPDPDRAPDWLLAWYAADWLLDQYEATDPDDIEVYDEDAGEYRRSAYIQPMFQLKSDVEPGKTMRVTRADYADAGRWRL